MTEQDSPVPLTYMPVPTRLTAGVRRVIHNMGWLLLDRVGRLGAGVLIGAWVARYLGPAQFGLLSFAVAVVSLFATVAYLGLDQLVVRELVANPDQKYELIGTDGCPPDARGVNPSLADRGCLFHRQTWHTHRSGSGLGQCGRYDLCGGGCD